MIDEPKPPSGSYNEPGASLSMEGPPSINEPPVTAPPPVELPPLVLADISPDTMVVGTGSFPLTVTGSGFDATCIVVFDNVDMPTAFVSDTQLTADCPVSDVAAVVDVEVHRGEEMSDVLMFDFTAVVTQRAKRELARKPTKGKRIRKAY